MQLKNQKSAYSLISQYFIIIIFAIVVLVFALLNGNFLSFPNIIVILKQTSILGIASFGMMFVIVSGEFDMSVGSTIAVAGILAALLGNGDYPIFVPLLAAIGCGTLIGFINGVGVAKGRVPAFIMTLGTMQIARGMALVISGGKTIVGVSEEYKAIAAGNINLALLFVAVIIICTFVLSKTVFGRRVYAIGGNAMAARVAGINTVRNKIAVFMIMGFLAGLCGFLMTSRTTVGQPTAAEGYEMDAIAACVIGGVSMSGGIGKTWGVVVGAFLMTVITNGLDSIGVDSSWQKVVKGIIIVVAVLIDMKGKKRE